MIGLMDNVFIRLAIVCVLAFLGFEAFKELKKPDREAYIELHAAEMEAFKEDHEGAEMKVPSNKLQNPIKLLTYFIILAAGVGFVSVKWLLPILGDAVGGATFSSGEKAEPSPYAKAIDLTTAGQYEEAVEEYKVQAEANPTDRFPLMELVKLQLGKLEDVEGAVATLEYAVNQEWEEKDGAFFSQRLADLYLDQKDSARAKELLQGIMQKYPGSVAAGNATQRIREIEEAEFIASRKQA
jgi:tetratricopeptide (TPR) repeat protein